MSFQWLQMRIAEEQERRGREARILEQLPRALEELYRSLAACIEAFNSAFGSDSATTTLAGSAIHVSMREPRSEIRILSVPGLPGFQIDRDGTSLAIEIGVLPGDKLSFRDRATDQYLTNEELTRRILDRVLFPKLKE
jgi:hypothetical protein